MAHIIDTEVDETGDDDPFSLGHSAPGEKMCSRGNRSFRSKQVPFPEFVSHHDIDKEGFEGDAPEIICSYCWSNTINGVAETQQRDDDLSGRIGTVGYRLRWKQKGRAREEWYDVVVSPDTTMAELDRLVCRFTTLDDFHLRMYGLEDEYLDSSLNVIPDHQYEKVADPTYTKASEMTVGEVAERADLWDGDRLSLVYDFGTPSYFYCIIKEIYGPTEIEELLGNSDSIVSTETAAILTSSTP
ncbi:hypothetical protein [Salinadaptatus halalkaliphilus]|uniref:hypothetical protein n=1 Tax=Salinadaptatus halalkaliphilus TaxID=2419781 RepID=UPI001FEB362D|nr:hypothetical protein [Salinadaptatus halalkaliphilus]